MSNPTASNGANDNNAPTSPMPGGTSPLDRRQQWRQRATQNSQRGRLSRWQGRPAQGARGKRAARPKGPAFPGQQAGEGSVLVYRKHPIFLVLPAWPAALALAGLGILLALHTTSVRLQGLFFILGTLLGIVFAIFLLKWLAIDLVNWLFNLYVLTDRRLMQAEGFFTPIRREAPLDRIQQVQVDRSNIFEYLMDFGDIQIVTAGSQGTITFAGITHPLQVADKVREYQSTGGGSKPADAPIQPKHPAVQKVLDEMAKPVVVAPPAGVPRRTFGGFLRRPATLNYLPNEVVLNYIYRHWFVLVRREVLPAVVVFGSLALGAIIAAFLHSDLWLVALAGVLGGAIWGGLVYLNYADDVFILTTDRIIDIDRFVFIFFEGRKQAEYSRVQDVSVSVDSLLGRILNYGDIMVETAGRLPNIEMSDIPEPFMVQDLIFNRMNALRERDAAAAANRQRMESRRIIAATMNELLVEVPDVRRLTLLEATHRLQDAGLRLVIDSERRGRGQPPGVVMAQMPDPLATALADSEVRVVLSGRA
jgi:membrane protein YdbS with pleckstrin-like domain